MVVVVTGAGIEVCCVVVVELWVSLSVLQPVIDNRAAAVMHERMIFFIIIFVIWFVYLRAHNCTIGWSKAMGCNPTKNSPVKMDCHRLWRYHAACCRAARNEGSEVRRHRRLCRRYFANSLEETRFTFPYHSTSQSGTGSCVIGLLWEIVQWFWKWKNASFEKDKIASCTSNPERRIKFLYKIIFWQWHSCC